MTPCSCFSIKNGSCSIKPQTNNNNSMRSCRRSVCFLLLMDSKLPPRVGRAWQLIRRVVHFGPRCINRLVSQSHGWSAQEDQAKVSILGLGVKAGHCPQG
ncbi:hypothetical protein AVEN_156680-1 [Araneus ventricosus]|uniref:Uncharacterized protein n=1 Tax=Araneus ventricosus TaxID=182803 RepID=A0A4Y2QMR3_ARAVE|nr:hypothetical protein AVEN_156680-1 [Araneus ventricosus]